MISELISGFDSEWLCRFLRNKFPSFSESRAKVPLAEDTPYVEAEQLGFVKTLPGPGGANKPLLVVAAKMPDGVTLSERSSRVRQFMFAKKTIDAALAHPAPGVDGILTQGLFVFYDDDGNFRLSLVFGKAEGTKLVWSSAKRLSFYVEAGAPNKTFRDRVKLDWSTFDKLKDAFSVEKLTKEFYSRLFAWYQNAMAADDLVFPNDIVKDKESGEVKSEQIIRLITRLMFVWFLKQKHLVPDKLFDPGKLQHILKEFEPVVGDNYYRAILQNLFFATLNSEIPERAFATQTGDRTEHFDIKTLYRYPKEFALSEAEVLELFKGIPFLNGGLFECLDRGRNYYDGFSRNRNRAAKVPNRVFFDPDEGLIPLLRQYNFTVEENSPGDEEVALDPELLGKVFENLLGAYNPETKVAARNATGSFYTPREIVNYMVDESLKAHVTGKLEKTRVGKEEQQKADEEAVGKLFAEGVRPGEAALCREIDDALTTARILDPACGSGAFPMGVLLRMVEVLRKLRGIPDDDHDAIYALKLQLIENCIYGGDIQSIAVQISKLRFFISLVCEQQPTQDAKNNYGVHTLPNLETKFVAADSLIGLPRSGDMLPMQNIEALKKELWEVRHKHFLARSYQEKKALRKEDKRLREALAKALEEGGGFDTESARLMAAWDPYDQNTSAPFSDPEWMFNVKDGFDVVIGNPPYISALEFKRVYGEELRAKLNDLFESATGAYDYFILFIEMGLTLCADGGLLCYISPNKYLAAKYASGLRQWLLDNVSIKQILDVSAIPVFDAAAVYPIVSFFAKAAQQRSVIACLPTRCPIERFDINLFTTETVSAELLSLLPENIWGFLLSRNVRLLPQIMEIAEPLSAFGEINATTTAAEADAYGAHLQTKRGSDGMKVINTGTIDRYTALWGHSALTHQGEKYLTPYLPIHTANVNERRTRMYKSGKVVFAKMAKRCEAVVDLDGEFASLNTNCFHNPCRGVSVSYIGAVCNSRMFMFLYDLFFGALRMSGGYYQFQAPQLRVIPIPRASKNDQEAISSKVTHILSAKKADPAADTSALEAEIDQLVYQLYGLTEEEIAIVEGATTEATQGKRGQYGEGQSKAAAKKPRQRKKAALPEALEGWD